MLDKRSFSLTKILTGNKWNKKIYYCLIILYTSSNYIHTTKTILWINLWFRVAHQWWRGDHIYTRRRMVMETRRKKTVNTKIYEIATMISTRITQMYASYTVTGNINHPHPLTPLSKNLLLPFPKLFPK